MFKTDKFSRPAEQTDLQLYINSDSRRGASWTVQGASQAPSYLSTARQVPGILQARPNQTPTGQPRQG